MNRTVNNQNEKLITSYNLLLLIAFCNETIFDFLKVFFRQLPVIGFLADYLVPAMAVTLVIWNLFVRKTLAVHFNDLAVTVLILLVLSINYLCFPQNQEYYNSHNMDLVFLKAIPFLFIGTNFVANKSGIRLLTLASYVAIVLNMVYVFSSMSSRDAAAYNMHYAYIMLPHVMFATHGLFNKELKLHVLIRVVLFVAGAFFIMAMGTRGPILIMLVYLGVAIWRNIVKLSPKKKAIVVVTVVVAAAYVLSTYLTLAENIRDFIEELGFSTRALDIFLEGEYISATSGRDRIYELLWEKLREKPFGYGVFGEWQFVNYSAHNIYLQICMYWGLLPGSIFIAFLLGMVARGYFSVRNKYARDMIVMYLVFTVVRSFFGGEFFSDYVFFLIGFSLQCITNKNNINRLENSDA